MATPQLIANKTEKCIIYLIFFSVLIDSDELSYPYIYEI
jgi:hypothetical protein